MKKIALAKSSLLTLVLAFGILAYHAAKAYATICYEDGRQTVCITGNKIECCVDVGHDSVCGECEDEMEK